MMTRDETRRDTLYRQWAAHLDTCEDYPCSTCSDYQSRIADLTAAIHANDYSQSEEG